MILKIIYGIIVVISLLLIFGYEKAIRDKSKWFVLLFISVFVVNSGYFAISIAGSLDAVLWANRLSYLGSVFLPLCMLMIVMDVCKMARPKWVITMLCSISIIVFLIAASGGYTDWYYASVSVEYIDGTAKLIKEYGPLHNIYYVYLLSYLITMVVMIMITYHKKKVIDYRHTVFLTCVVVANECVWLVEQLIRVDFEFLSISYIITEVFMLFLYAMVQESAALKERQAIREAMTPGYLIATVPELQVLTGREKEVLKLILEDAKRKDIAEALCVSENTIKKHTANIFTKMGVVNRKELYSKLDYRP